MLPRRNMGTSNLFSLKKTWGLDISVPVDFCCYVTDLYSIKMAEINKKKSCSAYNNWPNLCPREQTVRTL